MKISDKAALLYLNHTTTVHNGTRERATMLRGWNEAKAVEIIREINAAFDAGEEVESKGIVFCARGKQG